jgi:hypothetical protein
MRLKIIGEIFLSLIVSIVIFLLIVYIGRGIIYLLDMLRGLDNDFIQTLFRDILIPGLLAPFVGVLLVQNSEIKIVIILKIILFFGVVFSLIYFDIIKFESVVFSNPKKYVLIELPFSCFYAYLKITSDLKDYGKINFD